MLNPVNLSASFPEPHRGRRGTAVLLLAAAFALAATPGRAGDLLVPDFDFEAGDLGHWSVTGRARLRSAPDPAFSGQACVHLDGPAAAVASEPVGDADGMPGTRYVAYVHSRGDGGSVSLEFDDAAGRDLGRVTATFAASGPRWTGRSVSAIAPAGAVQVRIRLASETGTDFDRVLLTRQLTDLGPQVYTANTHTAVFTHAGGANRLYLVRDGALDGGRTPGQFVVVDPDAGRILQDLPLPGSEGSWGVTVATDGTVYTGVYATGEVFRFRPGDKRVTSVGRVPGQSFLYYLCPGADGAIYGGTYPDAKVFRYAPAEGFSLWPQDGPAAPGTTYVRGTAFDPRRGVVYAAASTPVKLIRWDPRTGDHRDILPAAHADEAFILGLRVAGGKVFARLADHETCVVLDPGADGRNVTEDAAFPMSSIYVSPEQAGEVYYTHQREICAYDLATKTTRRTGAAWPSNGYELGLLTLADQAGFPGATLMAVGNRAGQIWLGRYNLRTGRTAVTYLPIPGVKQSLESIIAGPDGRIYSSGYLTGGTGIYTPMRDDVSPPTRRGVSQAEGIATLAGKIYYGGYPGALLYEHDPARPWVEAENPRILFNLTAEEQDRPFGMSSGGGRVIMGTAPNYGHLGGALCLYDPATGGKRIRGAKALGIPDLALIATCWADGIIYGGTSVSGGIGAAPTQTRARLLRYDIAADRGEGIALPDSIPNQAAITAVCPAPDGRIWLMCEGWLVVYDPATRAFVHQANLFPDVAYHPQASLVTLRDATLRVARDGCVYGTIHNRHFFRIDPRTYAMTIVRECPEGCVGLTADAYGNLYFIAGTDLVRWAP